MIKSDNEEIRKMNDDKDEEFSDLYDSPHNNKSTRPTKNELPWGNYIQSSSHSTYKPEQKEWQCKGKVAEDLNNTYDMTGFPRGVMAIFDMQEYSESTGLKNYPRKGTEKDANAIRDVFLDLGFVVHIYSNVTRHELFSALEDIEISCCHLNCFACAILSHGTEGYVYSRDGLVQLSDVFGAMESKYWVGKPKLFFIQACQGSKHMEGMRLEGLDEVDAPLKGVETFITLPTHSDFFFAYSTVSGYTCWRNTVHGSWFIQEVCKCLRKYSHELDLSRIMTRANSEIALRFTRTETEKTNKKRQIASFVNQLRKDLYFNPPSGTIKRNDNKGDSFQSLL